MYSWNCPVTSADWSPAFAVVCLWRPCVFTIYLTPAHLVHNSLFLRPKIYQKALMEYFGYTKLGMQTEKIELAINTKRI